MLEDLLITSTENHRRATLRCQILKTLYKLTTKIRSITSKRESLHVGKDSKGISCAVSFALISAVGEKQGKDRNMGLILIKVIVLEVIKRTL